MVIFFSQCWLFFVLVSYIHLKITTSKKFGRYFKPKHEYDINLFIPCLHEQKEQIVNTQHVIEAESMHHALKWCFRFMHAIINDADRPKDFEIQVKEDDYDWSYINKEIVFFHKQKVILTCKKREK